MNYTDSILKKHVMSIILEKSKRIFILGRGEEVGIFISFLLKSTKCELKKIVGILDENNDNDSSEKLGGVSVLPLGETDFDKGDVVFIVSLDPRYQGKMIKLLLDKGLNPLQVIPAGCFLPEILSVTRGFLHDIRLNEIQCLNIASIDIVDTCNLRCATCARKEYRGSSHKMDFDLFCQILDKVKLLGIPRIELYNWTEPFLHPEIFRFVQAVKKRGFQCGLSTNLALKNIPDLKATIDLLNPNDRDLVVVTVSGYQPEIYNINHCGGNIDYVIENLKIASRSNNKQVISLRLLQFDYNLSEIEQLSYVANQLGIRFHIHKGAGDPVKSKKPLLGNNDCFYFDKDKTQWPYHEVFDHTFYCFFNLVNSLTINANGNVHLCCNVAPSDDYEVGSFLEQDFSVIQLKRVLHPACEICRSTPVSFNEKMLHLLMEGMKSSFVQNQLKPWNYYCDSEVSSIQQPMNIEEGEYLIKVTEYFLKR